MLKSARNACSALIFALIAARAFTGEAVAAERQPCTAYDDAVPTILANAAQMGAYITLVPPTAMERFTKLMHAKGFDIEGDSALVWIGPAVTDKKNLLAVYVKHGKQLCIGVSMASGAAKGDDTEPSTPGAERF